MRTRAATSWGPSPGRTGTERCARMGPVSYSSSTKCTVAPLKRAPLATTALRNERAHDSAQRDRTSDRGW